MSRSDEKSGVDVDSTLEQLGGRGRYQVIQLMLSLFPWFLVASLLLDIVFIEVGKQPVPSQTLFRTSHLHPKRHEDNDKNMTCVKCVTTHHKVEAYLPDDVTNFTLHDIQYHECSIDVTVNTSGTSSTHSLPCVAGVNFSMPSYTSFVTEWSLVCDRASFADHIQTGIFGGQVAGIVASSILADRYGRKKVYLTCALLTMVSLFATVLVPNYYFFLVCKVIAGFFGTGMDKSAYTMFMELVAPEWRSLGSVVGTVVWTGGCVFMAIVAYCLQGVSWRYLSLAFSSVYVFSLLLPWFLDESLRWLLATGNIKEAERILKKACWMNGKDFDNIQTFLKRSVVTGNNNDDHVETDSSPTTTHRITKSNIVKNDKNKEDTNGDELNDEKTADISAERRGSGSDQRDPEEGGPGNDSDEGSSQQMPETEVFSAKYTVLDLFRHRVVLVPLLVVTFVWVILNLYYYTVMLGSASLSGNRFLSFALLNLLDIPATFVALFLIRSKAIFEDYITSSIGRGGHGVTLTLATAAQYVGMFAVTGSYILLFVYYMEVFPTTMRAIGTGTAGMAAFTANMAAPYLLLATKLIGKLKDKPYPERLSTIKLPSLEHRRRRGDMIDLYKYITGIYDTSRPNFELHDRYNTRGQSYLRQVWTQQSTGQKLTLTMSRSDGKKRVDLDSILEHLGGRSRYQVIQLMLNIFPCFLETFAIMDIVFTGYQPDHQCAQVHNATQVEAYLPDDVTNFTLHDIQYHQCSIDVTVNTSGTSSTHSLPCVAGVNFSMPSHTSFVTEWSLVCEKAGLAKLTQTGVFGGQLLGNMVAAILADRYGRKKVYMTCALVAMVCLFGMALIPNYYFFLLCRIAVGFFAMAMTRSGFIMFMELIDRKWRSIGSVMSNTMWAGGCVFMAIVAYCLQGVSWRYLSLAFYSLYVFSLLSPWLLDESLRWLLATGNIEEAGRILKKACQMNGKDFEKIQTLMKRPIVTSNNFDDHDQTDSSPTIIERITESSVIKKDKNEEDVSGDKLNDEKTDDISAERRGSASDQRDPEEGGPGNDSDEGSSQLMPETEVFSAKYTVLDLFRHCAVLVPLFVVTFVWATSSLYYFVVMLGSAKLSGNRFLNFALLNLQEIPSNIVALFLMHRFNRRPLACTYALLACSFLFISVGLSALGGQGLTMTLATAAQYVGMFAVSGSFSLLFVYIMEVFPTTMRSAGVGTAGIVSRVATMGAPFLLLWAEETPWAPGVMVGCLCCLASASIWLLPETRHRKLPDTIEEIRAWKGERMM
ncbi:uncharacterized protein LOC143297051 [Babylonia areolata]|uniref:uncharacterized protein LOC143297051 n=1 Tax=Babylonia areolata TaxID=304850 RepID=UPI003FD1B2CE